MIDYKTQNRLFKSFIMLMFLGIILLVQLCAYRGAYELGLSSAWLIIPIVAYPLSIFINKLINKLQNALFIITVSNFIALMAMWIIITIPSLNTFVSSHFEAISLLIMAAILLFSSIATFGAKSTTKESETSQEEKIFNLFYINTSKTHEIAMLLDNKIMKTIEKEQVSEGLIKRSGSVFLGKKDALSSESGFSIEESDKKRVYESFDVKTTKSIMLRKIYDVVAGKDLTEPQNAGTLTVFENVELVQRNLDDTIMILNVLQDSKIKNETSDSIEINVNKMMEKMLDDFTIDYTFTVNSKAYLIQIPYKSSENFENGYHHNDLQLGKLSVVGICRGEIDFSQRECISSKFLELLSESYNQEQEKTKMHGSSGMKLSYLNVESNPFQFEFKHKKLKEKLNLIDVIAIIQDLKTGGE